MSSLGSTHLWKEPRKGILIYSHKLPPKLVSVLDTTFTQLIHSHSMDFVSTVLGLQLPALNARDALREHSIKCSSRAPARSEVKIVWGGDAGSDLDSLSRVPEKSLCDDDETASTLSDCDASFSSSSEGLDSCVSFAPCLVTEVHLRPCTERSERQHLYYNEADFRRFRMEYRQSLYRRKQPSVTFSSSVVSHVHCLPAVENKHEVYYSSSELKQ